MGLITFLSAISMSLSGIDYKNDLGVKSDEYSITINNSYANSFESDINSSLQKPWESDGSISSDVSEKINSSDLLNWIENNYPNFSWLKSNEKSKTTKEISNAEPIEMRSSLFTRADLTEAIKRAGIDNITSYGGCAPISQIGIFDYFSRYLGYKEFINDTSNANDRIAFATEVFSKSNVFSEDGNVHSTSQFPLDYARCFTSILEKRNLENNIEISCWYNLTSFLNMDFGNGGYGDKEKLWSEIVKSIDNGMPVTMWTGGPFCGEGMFANHSVNVYGYETWIGTDNNREQKVKRFIKARLNSGSSSEWYCDADILGCPFAGIFIYKIKCPYSYSATAKDFNLLVNNNGQGQYFFGPTPRYKTISLPNGLNIQTERIRASYIENKYLVLSPNRKNAGEAYLVMKFPHKVSSMEFTASMWGPSEGSFEEKFELQYSTNGSEYNTFLRKNCPGMSTSKLFPDNYKILFPKNVTSVRFVATHSNPSGDKNKGRICIDNFMINGY